MLDDAFDGDVQGFGSSSQTSRFEQAQALLLDASTQGANVNAIQTVEEAITDPAQQQRSRFVRINYLFVMYLMTFHGLSNTIVTLYLSFVMHVLSRFCSFAINNRPSDSAAAAAAAATPLPIPPPSSPPPPPPLPMRITPASIRSRLGMHSDFDQYLVCPRCGELTPWDGFQGPTARQILCACGTKLLRDPGRRPVHFYCHRTLESILSGVLMDREYYEALMDWLPHAEQAHAAAAATTATSTACYREIPSGLLGWRIVMMAPQPVDIAASLTMPPL